MITNAKVQFAPTAIYVHGYSYGTRWAQRYLQMFPGTADKVIIEGVVAKNTVFNDFAVGSQYGGTRFMNKCLLDSVCKQYFTDTSLSAKITTISNEGTTNPCTLVWAVSTDLEDVRDGVQAILYTGLQYGVDGPFENVSGYQGQTLYVDWRAFALALISRWSRCKNSAANFKVFTAGISFLVTAAASDSAKAGLFKDAKMALQDEDFFNDIVYGMIAYSELRRYPMESQTSFETTKSTVDWGISGTFSEEKANSDAWGLVKYPTDVYSGNAPSGVQSKLLIVNGEIDGQTPRFQAYDTFNDITTSGAGTKTLAIIPDMGHHASGFGCGKEVVKSFLAGSVDTSCAITSEATPISPSTTGFTIAKPFSVLLLGSEDIWAGDVSSSFCSPTGGSVGDTDYCLTCFNYCLTLTNIGAASTCQCASNLGTCLRSAGLTKSTDACQAVLSIYGDILPEYNPGGSCYSACFGSFLLLPVFAIAIIAAGGVLFSVLALVAVIYYQRKRRNQSGMQGNVVLASPAYAGGGTQMSVVVAQPVSAVVVAQPVSSVVPPRNIPPGGGVILSAPAGRV